MSIRVGQINLRRSKVASAGVSGRDYDLLVVQEPYSYKNKVTNVSNYRTYYTAGKNRPRTCIYANINCWNVDEFSEEDITTVAIPMGKKRTMYVSSVYLDIEKSIEYDTLKRLIEKCDQNKIPLVIGLDSNAHGSLWGCDDLNKRGEELEIFILQNDLFLSNVGSVPTFDNDRTKSIIDITLYNRWSIDVVDDWKVNEGESLSDHKYIEYSLKNYEPYLKTIRNFRKADWEQFERVLKDKKYTVASVDDAAATLETDINEGLDVACPMRKTLNRRPCKWWSAEIERLSNQVRVYGSVRNNNIYNMMIFKRLRAELKTAIREAKIASWQKFVRETQSVKDTAGLIKILEGNKAGVKTISLMKEDGAFCSSPDESLKVLMSTHFPNYTNVDDQVAESDLETDEVVKYIDTFKTKAAFDSFGPYKAAGADGLKPIVLQKLPVNVQDFVAAIYRRCISRGYTPKLWRQMKVVFIPKVGKGDYSLPKAYRPITLSNFLLKGLERIVQWYILERRITKPLKHQHAYTKGLSTETALSNFLTNVESMVHRGKKTLAVSLDCSGAFDKIRFDSAVEAMENYNFPNNIIRWYDGLLKNRRVTADVQGCSLTVTPTQGSPQGGILSPLVWNLIMDSLLCTFNDSDPVRVIGYADDILLYINGNDPATMKNLMQKTLKKVDEWGLAKGLTFSPEKSMATMFERNRKTVNEPILYMGNQTLKYSDRITYLGMTITKRLTWTPPRR